MLVHRKSLVWFFSNNYDFLCMQHATHNKQQIIILSTWIKINNNNNINNDNNNNDVFFSFITFLLVLPASPYFFLF